MENLRIDAIMEAVKINTDSNRTGSEFKLNSIIFLAILSTFSINFETQSEYDQSSNHAEEDGLDFQIIIPRMELHYKQIAHLRNSQLDRTKEFSKKKYHQKFFHFQENNLRSDARVKCRSIR